MQESSHSPDSSLHPFANAALSDLRGNLIGNVEYLLTGLRVRPEVAGVARHEAESEAELAMGNSPGFSFHVHGVNWLGS